MKTQDTIDRTIRFTQGPVKDRTFWDANGNSCRIELYCIGPALFELYLTDFNSSVPRRFVGTLGDMIKRGDLFVSEKEKAGFQSAFPMQSQCTCPVA